MKKLELIEKYGEEWYKEHILKQGKQWHQDNKEKHNEQNKQWQKDNPIQTRANNLLSGYRRLDKDANRGECTLTADWIINNIFNSKCVFCGEDDWTKLGCDRIDNSKPHTEDNVQCCCGECNVKKHTYTNEQFLEKK